MKLRSLGLFVFSAFFAMSQLSYSAAVSQDFDANYDADDDVEEEALSHVKKRAKKKTKKKPEAFNAAYKRMKERIESYKDHGFITHFRAQYLGDEDPRTIVRSIALTSSTRVLSVFAGYELDPGHVSSIIHYYGMAVAALKIPHKLPYFYSYETTQRDSSQVLGKVESLGIATCRLAMDPETWVRPAKTLGAHYLLMQNLPVGAVAQLALMYYEYATEPDSVRAAEILENLGLDKLYSDRSSEEYLVNKAALTQVLAEARRAQLSKRKQGKAE